jgi:tetratricopeptide (TPR) repeat protein
LYQAESLYQRALTIREQVLEPNHPHLAETLNNLAWLYNYQGKYAQAELLYQRALALYEQALGVEHPDTARVRAGYANLLRKRQETVEAAQRGNSHNSL